MPQVALPNAGYAAPVLRHAHPSCHAFLLLGGFPATGRQVVGPFHQSLIETCQLGMSLCSFGTVGGIGQVAFLARTKPVVFNIIKRHGIPQGFKPKPKAHLIGRM